MRRLASDVGRDINRGLEEEQFHEDRQEGAYDDRDSLLEVGFEVGDFSFDGDACQP